MTEHMRAPLLIRNFIRPSEIEFDFDFEVIQSTGLDHLIATHIMLRWPNHVMVHGGANLRTIVEPEFLRLAENPGMFRGVWTAYFHQSANWLSYRDFRCLIAFENEDDHLEFRLTTDLPLDGTTRT